MEDLVFLIRQSPNWGALANDYEAGRAIDVRRFKPCRDIPGFPQRIEYLISSWNRLFGLNFFRCRQILKEIALNTVRCIPGSRVVAQQNYPLLAEEIATSRALIFYMDDDDWFAPDMRTRVAGIDLGMAHIAVFPLVRLERATYTFVRPGEPVATAIGSCRNFDFRFQTNNYGIRADRVPRWHIPYLSDHVEGSVYADRQRLTDVYFDRIISATSKTPCSASSLPGLFEKPDQAIELIRQYADALRGLPVPASASWLGKPMQETLALFDRVIASAQMTRAI